MVGAQGCEGGEGSGSTPPLVALAVYGGETEDDPLRAAGETQDAVGSAGETEDAVRAAGHAQAARHAGQVQEGEARHALAPELCCCNTQQGRRARAADRV